MAGKRVGGFSLGMGQRLGVASALLGNPQTVVLDEPVNGLDPEGVLWMRTMLKDLAADGHTVFVSSHLMSEMAQTATRLVVIGRGRLIADTTVEEFVARASQHVRHRPHPGGRHACATCCAARTSPSAADAPDVLHDRRPDRRARSAPSPGRPSIPIFELAVQQASLEEAFMKLTGDSVEYRSTGTASTVAVAA